MDVTSMLNSSSVTAERSPKSMDLSNIPKAPLRSRTPWDAGGYSLPINTRTNSFSFGSNVQYSDSPTRSPRESSHRPSDSYSSLSSYASSITSGPHSRFSSISTVSGFHLLNNIIADDNSRGEWCSAKTIRSPLSAVSPSLISKIPISDFSSVHSTEAVVDGLERRIQSTPRDGTNEVTRRNSEMTLRPPLSAAGRALSASTIKPRPRSPSDAILIKRPVLLEDLLESSERSKKPSGQNSLHEMPGELRSRLCVNIHNHKRAVSAPDFQGIFVRTQQRGYRPSPSHDPILELTPPLSQHPDHESPGAPVVYNAPNTPTEAFSSTQQSEEVPRCMYIADCDTGSQPRKAVSHIFGRNKMCTRLIPKMVWVYYCRKHYQRTRYRNAKEYVKLQYDLVVQQIKQLQEWSEKNLLSGRGGVVKDWSIAVRKREQKRLDEQKTKGNYDQDDSGEDEPRVGNVGTATAVPQWLLDQCNSGYSTEELTNIVDRLGAELLSGTVSVFPDIEILPNIIVDREEAMEPKGYTKRKTTHQRSQSLGIGMRGDVYPRSRSMSSQPMPWPASGHPCATSPQVQVLKKRKRYSEDDDHVQRLKIEFPSNFLNRFGHRQTFPNIIEHGHEYSGYEAEFDGISVGGYHGGNTYQPPTSCAVQISPLPAPTPQRYQFQSTAIRLESQNDQHHNKFRRSIHKRSQSAIGAPYSNQSNYIHTSCSHLANITAMNL